MGCNNRQYNLCSNEDCDICLKRSFATHEKSKYWSTRNKGTPRDYCLNSGKKFWFDCHKCKHDFDTRLNDIVSKNQWCSYCASKKLCDNDDCVNCFQKSFKSHEKSKYWSLKNGDKNPRDYFLHSHEKFWFDCDKCEHDFETQINSIVSMKSWCSYCANPSNILCDNEDCNDCFQKSFKSHEKSKYWDYENNDGSPRDYFLNSTQKFWFKCENKHKYETSLSNITNNNRWCPLCKKKTEYIVLKCLNKLYNDDIIEYQKCFPEILKSRRSFDFCIGNKIILELDGNQHFKQVSNWVSPEKTQDNDFNKMFLLEKEGYIFIRISQEYVLRLFNKNDKTWEDELYYAIETDENVFISDNNVYDEYIKAYENYKQLHV